MLKVGRFVVLKQIFRPVRDGSISTEGLANGSRGNFARRIVTNTQSLPDKLTVVQ